MAIYLDDAVMNGKKDVLDYLKLDPKIIPNHRKKLFEFTHKKADQDGRVRIKKSIFGSPEFSVFVPHLGREVKIRYAVTQRRDKDKNFIYSPPSIGIEPAEDGTVVMNNDLEFLFWFLRPLCKNSPFRTATQRSHYEYQDNDFKATTELDLEENRVDAVSIVIGNNAWAISKLRMLLKGLNESGVDDMTDVIVRKKLKDRAYANPIDFINIAESREVMFSGKLQECIDRKILKVESKLGMKRWYLLEEEILPLQYGVDEVRELKNFLSVNWHLFAETIQNALGNKTVERSLNKPELDQYFADNKVEPVIQRAEVTPAFNKELRMMEEDAALKDKIIMLSKIDPNDKSVNIGLRQSYKSKIKFIEAYLESIKEPEPEPEADPDVE